jgi:transposase InsO family protein
MKAGGQLENLLDGKALSRYEAIAPLLDSGIEAGERRRLRARIMEDTGMSERTLRRHVENYRRNGLAGLADSPRSDKGMPKSIPGHIIDEAVRLREELPARSVRQIIEILEGERLIKPGSVARTTLNDKLIERGVGAKRMRAMASQRPARRFARRHRNSLWQLDVKFGPQIGGDRKVKTYLLALIDDATRMCVHAEFYASQRLPILEDAFRKALLKYGRPKDVLVDNGSIFVSKWFRRACAQLGVRHIAAKAYSPETKGKCEKYNKTVSSFLQELSLEPARTLAEINRKFVPWLEEGYIHRPHSALATETIDPVTGATIKGADLTPYQAYVRDPAKIKYIAGAECREAFLWEETRHVDKTGCIKLRGKEYDVGAGLAGARVDVRYDPFELSVVDVWHKGKFVRKASPLVIGEWTAAIGAATAKPAKATHSRLLKVYEERNRERDKARNSALSFYKSSEPKGGAPNDD